MGGLFEKPQKNDEARGEEESSHLSIKNQDVIKDHRDEERINDNDIQESALSPPKERTYLKSYIPFLSFNSQLGG
jgi:hypothetical protein